MPAAAALPLCVVLTTLAAAPDGRLHVTYLPERGHDVALVTTPRGMRILISDAVDGQTVQPPPGLGTLDLWIGPACPNLPGDRMQVVDPQSLPPGARLRTADGVTLERLGDGSGWALALRYGQFGALLPSLPDAKGQALLAANGDLSGMTVVKFPGPETGRWPAPEILAAGGAQVQLWPDETTYPPGVVRALEGRARRVPPEAVIHVTTDGERFWLRQAAGRLARGR
jgi:hypothetical protein